MEKEQFHSELPFAELEFLQEGLADAAAAVGDLEKTSFVAVRQVTSAQYFALEVIQDAACSVEEILVTVMAWLVPSVLRSFVHA